MNYLKWGAIGALLIGLSVFWYRQGGASARAALAAFQAAQAENTAKAVLAERAAGAAELARVNTLLEGYQNAKPDPAVSGIAVRLLGAPCVAVGAVPSAGAVAATATAAGGVPGGDSAIERATEAAFDAAERDAARLNLCRAVWPK